MSTPVQIIGGNFRTALDTPIANGRIVARLVGNAQAPSSDAQVLGEINTTIPLDSDGNVSGTHYLWANSALIPATTYYSFMLYSADGEACWRRFLAATIPDQTTYDLSNLNWN